MKKPAIVYFCSRKIFEDLLQILSSVKKTIAVLLIGLIIAKALNLVANCLLNRLGFTRMTSALA